MQIYECIKARRSVRLYISKALQSGDLYKIIESAIWAPSEKNIQPWKFKVITQKYIINEISKLSLRVSWVKSAPCLVLIYLNKSCSYHYLKDVQSCAAAIQNMLLVAHEMGIGSCWIGELLENADSVNKLVSVCANLELMGVVSFGYARVKPVITERKKVSDFLL